MVDWFGLGKLREQLKGTEASLRGSIEQVRTDQANLSQWIFYLQNENRQLRQRVEWRPAQTGLNEEQVRTLVEKHAAFDIILERIHHIENRINQIAVPHVPKVEDIEHRVEARLEAKLRSERDEVMGQLRLIAEKVSALETQPRELVQEAPLRIQEQPQLQHVQTIVQPTFSKLQHKLLKRIAKHSKPVVKSSILTLIRKYGRIAGTELREMVVEEQQLCSKSSFYRLLEELEKEGAIEAVSEGKEKMFFDALKTKNRV
mgnify:CR=1 FL=1